MPSFNSDLSTSPTSSVIRKCAIQSHQSPMTYVVRVALYSVRARLRHLQYRQFVRDVSFLPARSIRWEGRLPPNRGILRVPKQFAVRLGTDGFTPPFRLAAIVIHDAVMLQKRYDLQG